MYREHQQAAPRGLAEAEFVQLAGHVQKLRHKETQHTISGIVDPGESKWLFSEHEALHPGEPKHLQGICGMI